MNISQICGEENKTCNCGYSENKYLKSLAARLKHYQSLFKSLNCANPIIQ